MDSSSKRMTFGEFSIQNRSSDTSRCTIKSIFTDDELESLPHNLNTAIERSEHNHLAKVHLGKLLKNGRSGLLNNRQKFSRALGIMGYEQLPLKPLDAVIATRERRLQSSTLTENQRKELNSIDQMNLRELMMTIIEEIYNCNWLKKSEQTDIVDTFSSEIATRFNDIQLLMDTNVSPINNRRMFICIFRKIRTIRDHALNACRKKKIKMEKCAMFNEEINSGRIVSNFRIEFNQRMNMPRIIEEAKMEIGNLNSNFEEDIKLKVDTNDGISEAIAKIFHEMPALVAIPENIMFDYNLRHNRNNSIQDSKLPERYKRKSSIFQFTQKEKILDPYANILHDLGKIRKRNEKSSQRRRSKLHDSDSDDNDWSDLDQLDGKTVENPVLRSHVEMVKKLKSKKEEIPQKAPERYLPKSMFARTSNFVVDKEETNFEHKKTLDLAYNELIMPNKAIFRSMNTKVSERKPKGLFDLSSSYSFGLSFNENDFDQLDEKWKRFKEVEELYDEIMKSIVGSHSVSKDNDDTSIFGCNTAPYDPHIPFSEAFLGFRPNYRRMLEIQLTMQKMASSIETPGSNVQNESSKKSKKEEEAIDFGIADYKDFLKVRKLDFISDLIVGTEEAVKALLDDEERRLREEEDSKKREEEEIKKKELHESLEFSYGTWNSKIINYIGDLKTRNGLSVIEEVDLNPMDSSTADNKKSQRKFSLLSKNPAPSIGDSSGREVQQMFEIIWSNLKMPLDQRIDMAIKHGNHRNSSISSKSLSMWQTSCDLILSREKILSDIYKFESECLHPERFFKPYNERPVSAHQKEITDRESLLIKLHSLEQKIYDITTKIKLELRQIVTYSGIPILEKIKNDYSEMIRKVESDRKIVKKTLATQNASLEKS